MDRHCRRFTRSLSMASGAAICAWVMASSGLLAAEPPKPGSMHGPHQGALPRDDALLLANQILNRWEPIAEQAGASFPSWREMFATHFARMDRSSLERLDALKIGEADSTAASYARFAQAVREAQMQAYVSATSAAPAGASGNSALKLASITVDQVFIPMTPCRIVDTRNVGGPIAAGTQRAFNWVRGVNTFSWSEQGGVPGSGATACPYTVFNYAGGLLPGSPADLRGYPSAAMATVTAVNPTAPGNLVIWGGQGTFPQSSALNFAAGQTLANTTVIPWGQRTGTGVQDFTVRYNGPSGQADVVVDLVGFFVQNVATPLDCMSVAGSSFQCAAGMSCGIGGPACPAGYTAVGASCDVGVGGGAILQDTSFGNCGVRNSGSTPISITVSARCCRVPGQ